MSKFDIRKKKAFVCDLDGLFFPSYGASKGDKGDTGATGAQGPKGDKGDTGDDGYSPTATVPARLNSLPSSPPSPYSLSATAATGPQPRLSWSTPSYNASIASTVLLTAFATCICPMNATTSDLRSDRPSTTSLPMFSTSTAR